jgi:hypothetical protein
LSHAHGERGHGDPVDQSRASRLVEADSFDRAHVDARAAIAARIGINDGQAILHRNRLQRARLDASFTSGAFLSVDYGCHGAISKKQS